MGYHDEFGDWHGEGGYKSIFKPYSKLQGNATLQLQPAPAAPGAGLPWPEIMTTPARAGAQTLIDLATEDELPHVVTISMGNIGPQVTWGGALGAGYEPEVVGIIDLGIGGIQIQVEVDFIQGTQFSIACSRLQLHAVFRCIPGGGAAVVAPIPTIQVGASVATGTMAHGRQPQRTLASTVNLAAAAGEFFLLPQFAKSLRVAAIPNNITPTVGLTETSGVVCASYPITAFPSADLPVPGDARIVWYQNTSLIVDTNRRLICELAL